VIDLFPRFAGFGVVSFLFLLLLLLLLLLSSSSFYYYHHHHHTCTTTQLIINQIEELLTLIVDGGEDRSFEIRQLHHLYRGLGVSLRE